MTSQAMCLLKQFAECCNASSSHPLDDKRFIKFIACMVKDGDIASWEEVYEILTDKFGWTHEVTRLWFNQYFNYLDAIQYVNENKCL